MTEVQVRKRDIAQKLGVSERVLEQYFEAKWAEFDNEPQDAERTGAKARASGRSKRRLPAGPKLREEV